MENPIRPGYLPRRTVTFSILCSPFPRRSRLGPMVQFGVPTLELIRNSPFKNCGRKIKTIKMRLTEPHRQGASKRNLKQKAGQNGPSAGDVSGHTGQPGGKMFHTVPHKRKKQKQADVAQGKPPKISLPLSRKFLDHHFIGNKTGHRRNQSPQPP